MSSTEELKDLAEQQQVTITRKVLSTSKAKQVVVKALVSTNQLINNIAVLTDSFGFVVTIDILDINVRPSFQTTDHATKLYHFCHAYAVLNRINTSTSEDGPPSGTAIMCHCTT